MVRPLHLEGQHFGGPIYLCSSYVQEIDYKRGDRHLQALQVGYSGQNP